MRGAAARGLRDDAAIDVRDAERQRAIVDRNERRALVHHRDERVVARELCRRTFEVAIRGAIAGDGAAEEGEEGAAVEVVEGAKEARARRAEFDDDDAAAGTYDARELG